MSAPITPPKRQASQAQLAKIEFLNNVVLSAQEERLLFAFRQIRDRQQNEIVVFSERMARDFPRRIKPQLTLLDGGVA